MHVCYNTIYFDAESIFSMTKVGVNFVQMLKGKRVAFCGRLTTEKRTTVIAKLEIIGGIYSEKVNARTDIFVLPLGFDESNKPKHLLDAEEFQEKGKLKIIDEIEFLESLKTSQA